MLWNQANKPSLAPRRLLLSDFAIKWRCTTTISSIILCFLVARRRPVVVPGFAVSAPDTPQDAAADFHLLRWECGHVGDEEVGW